MEGPKDLAIEASTAMTGEATSDKNGFILAVGVVNGDGNGDVAIGTSADLFTVGDRTGKAHVVFG